MIVFILLIILITICFQRGEETRGAAATNATKRKRSHQQQTYIAGRKCSGASRLGGQHPHPPADLWIHQNPGARFASANGEIAVAADFMGTQLPDNGAVHQDLKCFGLTNVMDSPLPSRFHHHYTLHGMVSVRI